MKPIRGNQLFLAKILISVLLICVVVMGFILVRINHPAAGSIVPEYPADCVTYNSLTTGSQIETFVTSYYRDGASSLKFTFTCDSSSTDPGDSIHNILTSEGKVIHDDLTYDAPASPKTNARTTCSLSDDGGGYAAVNCGVIAFKMYYR